MDRLTAILQDIEEAICDDDTLIDEYTKIEGMTPLDIMLEKERRREAIAILRAVLPNISRKNRKIIWLYAIKGISLTEIGRRLNISRQGLTKKVDALHKKIDNILIEHKEYFDWVDTFRPPQSIKEAHTPEVRGYPFDVMKTVSVECVKVKLDGIMRFRNKWECRIPDYLQSSFGDEKTVCSLCKNCSVTTMRERRGITFNSAA